MKHVMAVSGPIPAYQLGIVMPHEHIACDIARHSGNQDNLLNDISLCEQELGWFKQAGGVTIVDVTTRDIGRDVLAGLRNVVGGEITDYTKMMAESREQALDRMIEDAARQGANAVVGVHFATSMIMQMASEILAYGTAVVVE